MPVDFPESHLDLLEEETRAFAVLATVMPDGTPQATPIWFDIIEGDIHFNTARGRVKEKNMLTRPEVALVILDPHDPYRYMQVRGAVEETEVEAREHIDSLAGKYTGTADFKGADGQVRVKYRLRLRAVQVSG
jgi:PPOX class probable F420-dependent enzyme